MRAVFLTLTSVAVIGAADSVQAAISYLTDGAVYVENFDGMPTSENPITGIDLQTNGSAHIQNGNAPFPGGWKDDSATDATYLSVPGWYLWSDVSTLSTTNGGANSHVQFRYGGGNASSGTGHFAFSYPALTDDKALGIRSASAFTNSNAGRRSYLGMQLVNNTGSALHSFTITYDGEQYSESSGVNDPDGFDLQWSLVASAAGWHESPTAGGFYNNGTSGVDYGAVADSFLSPVNDNTGAKGVDGNIDGADRDITFTATGITWAPGADLWIRWRDHDTHDGIAIDNVRFSATAVPEPGTLVLAGLGLAALGLIRSKRSA